MQEAQRFQVPAPPFAGRHLGQLQPSVAVCRSGGGVPGRPLRQHEVGHTLQATGIGWDVEVSGSAERSASLQALSALLDRCSRG